MASIGTVSSTPSISSTGWASRLRPRARISLISAAVTVPPLSSIAVSIIESVKPLAPYPNSSRLRRSVA